MEIIKVKSSFIEAIQYNVDSQQLKIVIGNTTYFYYGITKQKVARLKKATSKGWYFCNISKDNIKQLKEE